MTDTKLSKILVDNGFISANDLNELRRWGYNVPNNPVPNALQAQLSPPVLKKELEQVFQERTVIRETDLDAMHQYRKTKKEAVLVLIETPEGIPVEVTTEVGRTYRGDILIPWSDEDDISILLTNGLTHLRYLGYRMYFKDSRELFHDNAKAFMVCTPSTLEPLDAPNV